MRIEWRTWRQLLAGLTVCMALSGCGADAPTQNVEDAVVRVVLDNQPITPVTTRFLNRALRFAESGHAAALVIELDTPGGLMESTQEIVRGILASQVPVIVYVAPQGARAASAGVFITMAAHVAAMAPATHIGAAHPVNIGGTPGTPQQEEPAQDDEAEGSGSAMDEKIENDAVAWVRSLAELRGRNADWAESTVRESVSNTADDALAENAIDLIAADLDDLMRQVNGRKIVLENDTLTVATIRAPVVNLEMWWGERLLGIISSPNIAFLLLILGFYGILFEFYSPGWGVGGTVGAICILLGFFGLAMLPINVVGFALLLLALALFVAEAFVSSFGALAAGGVVCLVVGGLMLIDSPSGMFRISTEVLIPVALATAAITVFLVTQLIRAQTRSVRTGDSALFGDVAVAVGPFTQTEMGYAGTVRIHGELWKAVGPDAFEKGDKLVVVNREGLVLNVKGQRPKGRG